MHNSAFTFEKALRNKTKKDILSEKLIEMIQSGLLQDGDDLPSERQLSQLFSVSRETVRSALSLLAAYGLIDISHGSKTRICASEEVLDRYRSARPNETLQEVNKFDIDSVFESRIIVEAAIARRVALRIDQSGIGLLERLLKTQSQLFDSPVYFQLSDQKFHKLISDYSGNEILVRYAEELYTYGLNIRRRVMMEEGAIERSYHEHARFVEALKLGNPDAAERAMLTHLDSVYWTSKQKLASE